MNNVTKGITSIFQYSLECERDCGRLKHYAVILHFVSMHNSPMLAVQCVCVYVPVFERIYDSMSRQTYVTASIPGEK